MLGSKLSAFENKILEVTGMSAKEWLYENRVKQKKSTHLLSRELCQKPYHFEISDTCVANYLKHYRIPIREK